MEVQSARKDILSDIITKLIRYEFRKIKYLPKCKFKKCIGNYIFRYISVILTDVSNRCLFLPTRDWYQYAVFDCGVCQFNKINLIGY